MTRPELVEDANLLRALARIFEVCRRAAVDVGPVMGPADFLHFPERLVGAFEDLAEVNLLAEWAREEEQQRRRP